MAILTDEVATKARGICSVCKHEADCIYPRSTGQIVLNCGQFEPCPPIAPPPRDRARVELERLWEKSASEESETKFKGLCCSCEDRHVCIYPKPIGGVWRCEEYR